MMNKSLPVIIAYAMKGKKQKVKNEPSCDTKHDEQERKPEDDSQPNTLKPSKLKIGESSENLKQRSEWFQKRTGKR